MTEKYITHQSSKIFYHTIGKGKPLILIHGFAEDSGIWKNQIEFLSAGSGGKDEFLLIVPDLPGTGKSQLIEDMRIESMAEVIRAILLAEKITECRLAGHSMGGYIALALVEKYPALFSSIALVHSSAFADSEEKKANRLKSIDFVKKNGAFEFLKAVITDLFTETWASNNRELVEVQIEKCKSFTDEAIINYIQAMIDRPDRTQVLKNINKPVLFIIGEHDKAIPFEQSMPQCYLPDESHIHILRNSAHMGMLEEAEKLNCALLEMK
ncbi:MAG: alpha/beta hydrolase [Chitinophagaceae bacterium]|nr:alpha/beta hydrolase [Chitinophagaceae bacterium]